MIKESFLQGLEVAIEEAAQKIKPLLLKELQEVKLPLIKIGVYDSNYKQRGVLSGSHWRNIWQDYWISPPSEGIVVEMPGHILSKGDIINKEYVILMSEGIFQMKQEQFFCDYEKNHTADFPSGNTRKEIAKYYIDYSETAFHMIEFLKASPEVRAAMLPDF